MPNTWNTTSLPYNNINYTLSGSSISSNGTWTTAPNVPVLTVADGVLKVSGDPASLDVKGKVVINGLDLEERLRTIERVLMIPERDATMEAKYPSLKKKFDEYITTLEKYKTFERIKGTNDD